VAKRLMKLVVEVGHGHIVLNGDPAPPPRKREGGHSSPLLFIPRILAQRLGGSRCHLIGLRR